MRRAIGILLILVFAASSASGVPGQPSITEQVMGKPVQPSQSVTFTDKCDVGDVLWNADSSRAYVSMSVRADQAFRIAR